MKEKTIERIRKFTEERDWDQFHSPANLAKSIVIEAAELPFIVISSRRVVFPAAYSRNSLRATTPSAFVLDRLI